VNALEFTLIGAPCRRLETLLRGPQPTVQVRLLHRDQHGRIERSVLYCQDLETARDVQRVAARAGSDSWVKAWRIG
jgi:hypothetical protein